MYLKYRCLNCGRIWRSRDTMIVCPVCRSKPIRIKDGGDIKGVMKRLKRRKTLLKKVSTEEIKKFGYPLKTYHFTGEYSEQIQGFYIIAGRNKKIVYAPIYEDGKGGTVIDMGQATNKKPI